jgi:hypothetical protein
LARVWRELVANGFDVRLAEPVQTRALLGHRRSAKTDRLDARWLAAAAGEGDAARVVDPTRADPRAARPHAAAQSAGRGPAPLGSAPARLPAARGLALLAVEPAQAAGAAVRADADSAGNLALSSRVTATRLVTLGVFAFAFKKKKKHDTRELYLAVETPDFMCVRKLDPNLGNAARQFAAKIVNAGKQAPQVIETPQRCRSKTAARRSGERSAEHRSGEGCSPERCGGHFRSQPM